jgi:DNA-binding winged helix-turn-helix (wHTH) protein
MTVKFGEYEFSRGSLALHRGGRRVKLTGQPLQLLVVLLERPGQVVTREEIRQRLWPDTHVGFEHSLNVVLNRLRLALDDRANEVGLIETVPRVGYRFAAPVVEIGAVISRRPPSTLRRLAWYAVIATAAALLALILVRQRYDKLVDRPGPPQSIGADSRK